MATTLFKEVTYSLSKLVEDIQMGEIGLPDIQRPFVWKNTKVRDLFDSMYKGFPVGYFLFWANGTGNGEKQIGAGPKQKVSRLLIVDGQQRLTSLFAVLKGIPVVRDDFREEHIRISFRPKDETFEVADAATRRDPDFIPDISELWAPNVNHILYALGFVKNLREHREVSDKEQEDILNGIARLFNLQDYPFTAMELSAQLDEERVAEVFVRINSKGTKLNQADFILTLMSVFWDEGRKELEDFCRSSRQPTAGAASPFNHFITPGPDQLLRVSVAHGFGRARLQYVYSLLRGKDLETGEFSDERRVQQFAMLKESQACALNLQNWHDYFKVLVRAGYRRKDDISSSINLLFCYAMFLIGKNHCGVEPFSLRNIIARWFFMTSLTARYSTSPESVMEQDLAGLRDVTTADQFIARLDQIIKDALTDDFWNITLPNELATSSARSPALFAYYAALNLLDARVLFSNMKVSELLDPTAHAHRAATERHHLFPKAHLKANGVKDTRIVNQIANFALVEWTDNNEIAKSSPAEYYPKYAERFKNELTQMLYWHALPEGWEQMEYEAFLQERRKRMAHVIRDGFRKLCEYGVHKSVTQVPQQGTAPKAPGPAKTEFAGLLITRIRLAGETDNIVYDQGQDCLRSQGAVAITLPLATAYDEYSVAAQASREEVLRCWTENWVSERDAERLRAASIATFVPHKKGKKQQRDKKVQVPKGGWTDWKTAMQGLDNPAMVSFFMGCADAKQECNLRRRMLMFRLQNRRRWFVSVRQDYAYVWQRGRFDADMKFWQDALSHPKAVQPVKEGSCLRFSLSSDKDFAFFRKAATCDLQSVEWNDAHRKARWSGAWFVNVGEGRHRNWDDCVKYGFLSAGQGKPYGKAMRKLKVGATVVAYMKGLGYVGVGTVSQAAVMAKDFTVGECPLFDLPLVQPGMKDNAESPDMSEWVVGVKWVKAYPRAEAKRFPGAFANQNVVCKLRDEATVAFLMREFGVAFGQAAEGEGKGDGDGVRVTEESFLQQLGEKQGETEVGIAKTLLARLKSHSARLRVTRAATKGLVATLKNRHGKQWLLVMRADGYVYIPFGWMAKKPPFDDRDKRIELARRLNEKVGADLSTKATERFETFALALLQDECRLNEFVCILDWIADQITTA